MSLPRTLALSLALCCLCGIAFAQSAGGQRALQQDMTPEEFKAAGLDKLSAEELARLNAWLDRKIDIETDKAAAQAKKKVEDDNRGFFNFGSTEPVVAHMVFPARRALVPAVRKLIDFLMEHLQNEDMRMF